MKLSTKTRYGVRLMQSLSEKYGQGPIYLKDIAAQQGISEKYLSLIVIPLRAAGLVLSTRGAHGGYFLSREPSQITLKDIVDVLEGETCLVHCIKDASKCTRAPICPTRDVWTVIGERISETLRGITLEHLVRMSRAKEDNLVMMNDITAGNRRPVKRPTRKQEGFPERRERR